MIVLEINLNVVRVIENFIEETKSFVRMKDYYDLVVKVSDIDGNLMIS